MTVYHILLSQRFLLYFILMQSQMAYYLIIKHLKIYILVFIFIFSSFCSLQNEMYIIYLKYFNI